MLSQDDYHRAIELTQVVSVDILIQKDEKYLLGKRINNPAKGYLFNPGGRVFKDESIREAAKRIIKDETGIRTHDESFEFSFGGAYEHHYPNNFRDDKFGTHYVSMLFRQNTRLLKIDPEDVERHMTSQHSEVVWMTGDEILESWKVHPYVKDFFRIEPPNQVK